MKGSDLMSPETPRKVKSVFSLFLSRFFLTRKTSQMFNICYVLALNRIGVFHVIGHNIADDVGRAPDGSMRKVSEEKRRIDRRG